MGKINDPEAENNRPDAKPDSSFANANRNLLNFPLARDARCHTYWRLSNKTGRWLCDLPYIEDIQFRLDGQAEESLRRCPTAFDINVLLLLLSEAQKQGDRRAEFRSQSAIVSALGLGIDPNSRRRLRQSLALWSALNIRYRYWYVPKHGRQHVVMPPPIAEIPVNSGSYRIVINTEWWALRESYFAQVPLPLPNNAAAQNLILWLLTSYPRHWDDDGDGPIARGTHPMPVKQLCRKLGNDHHMRKRVLVHTCEIAQGWFDKNGGWLVWKQQEDKIVFGFGEPVTPKSRDKRRKRQAREDARLHVGLQSPRNRCDLSALRGHRRLRLFNRRVRHDSARLW